MGAMQAMATVRRSCVCPGAGLGRGHGRGAALHQNAPVGTAPWLLAQGRILRPSVASTCPGRSRLPSHPRKLTPNSVTPQPQISSKSDVTKAWSLSGPHWFQMCSMSKLLFGNRTSSSRWPRLPSSNSSVTPHAKALSQVLRNS